MPRCSDLWMDRRVDKHLRFQPAFKIGHVDAYLDSARLVVEHGLDEGDASVELFSRIGFRRNCDILAIPNPGQVRFVRVQVHPHEAQIGDRVYAITQTYSFAFLS